jgi:hypothetical protein
MQTAEVFEKERLEVDAILASGIFSRAPNLAHLLKYVCEKYFDGASEEIKEYNIAVEALGRRADFDQKRDSIVRVEAHRLRKRLREFYETEGAHHELHIEIPSGQYTPRFIFVNPAPEVSAAPAFAGALAARPDLPGETVVPYAPSLPAAAPPFEPSSREPALREDEAMGVRRFSRRWWVAIAIVAMAAMVTALFAFRSHEDRASSAAAARITPAAGMSDEIRILCGVENGGYRDAFERPWGSDRYYSGGFPSQAPRGQVIQGTRDQQIYRNRREGNFRYDIPLKAGVYELRLYFAETMFGENNAAGGGEAARLFEVRLNDKTLLSYFDVISDAGPSVADIKVFKDVSPGPDGMIHLEFVSNTNTPFLNAIAIVPGLPGRIRPYRIAARDRGLIDNQGRTWDPDHYARGGQIIARPNANVQNEEPELFRSERFGNLIYTLPVAQSGRYTVNLYFTETWFGPDSPGGGGVGSRTFDILVNGVMLRKNFDIFKESGGTGRAAIVSERGIEPNHQGKIVISLAPNQNYACINALEVIDESR